MSTANLCTKIVDFRGYDSSIILILRGGILMSLMSIMNFLESFESSNLSKFPGKFELSNLSRDHLSREIGRTVLIPCS